MFSMGSIPDGYITWIQWIYWNCPSGVSGWAKLKKAFVYLDQLIRNVIPYNYVWPSLMDVFWWQCKRTFARWMNSAWRYVIWEIMLSYPFIHSSDVNAFNWHFFSQHLKKVCVLQDDPTASSPSVCWISAWSLWCRRFRAEWWSTLKKRDLTLLL